MEQYAQSARSAGPQYPFPSSIPSVGAQYPFPSTVPQKFSAPGTRQLPGVYSSRSPSGGGQQSPRTPRTPRGSAKSLTVGPPNGECPVCAFASMPGAVGRSLTRHHLILNIQCCNRSMLMKHRISPLRILRIQTLALLACQQPRGGSPTRFRAWGGPSRATLRAQIGRACGLPRSGWIGRL